MKVMKNILSYKSGTIFTGKEINDWLDFNLTNKTGQQKQAIFLNKHYRTGLSHGFKNDAKYILAYFAFRTNGKIRPGFLRLQDRSNKYNMKLQCQECIFKDAPHIECCPYYCGRFEFCKDCNYKYKYSNIVGCEL